MTGLCLDVKQSWPLRSGWCLASQIDWKSGMSTTRTHGFGQGTCESSPKQPWETYPGPLHAQLVLPAPPALTWCGWPLNQHAQWDVLILGEAAVLVGFKILLCCHALHELADSSSFPSVLQESKQHVSWMPTGNSLIPAHIPPATNNLRISGQTRLHPQW